jgi:mevalonate kinase
MSESFRSHGKLLLTGEYAVLDGAEALGLPTRLGQQLHIERTQASGLIWKSFDSDHNLWFETVFQASELSADREEMSGSDVRGTLLRLLRETVRLRPDFLEKAQGSSAISKLEFPREWGLGSSSTLISNLALWAGADPYTLLWNAFAGSGYDIACAQAKGPVIYRVHDRTPEVETANFNPVFKDRLYFIHLKRKQNSREAISHYRRNVANRRGFLDQVSEITRTVAACSDWEEFKALLYQHEVLLSDALQISRIQDQLFPDFDGLVKSLGAWGGDFVLATGNGDVPAYFADKGYRTVLRYDEIIL